MNKYVVIKILNSSLDACTIRAGTNPSGACTCSTGDGTPWAFAESSLLDKKEEALARCDKLHSELLDDFTARGVNEGWEISDIRNCVQALRINLATGDSESVWISKAVVLEIPVEQE